MKFCYFLLFIPFVYSCTTVSYGIQHKYNLIDDSIENTDPNTYTDSLISIVFTPEVSSYGFTFINKTDQPIYINWEETSFIVDGKAGPVINKDVDFYDKSLEVKPTLVPPGMKREDEIIPVENIVINEYGAYLKPTTKEIVSTSKEQSKNLVNSKFTQGVYLTLNTGDGPIAYNFVFESTGRIYEKPKELTSQEKSAVSSIITGGLIVALIAMEFNK